MFNVRLCGGAYENMRVESNTIVFERRKEGNFTKTTINRRPFFRQLPNIYTPIRTDSIMRPIKVCSWVRSALANVPRQDRENSLRSPHLKKNRIYFREDFRENFILRIDIYIFAVWTLYFSFLYNLPNFEISRGFVFTNFTYRFVLRPTLFLRSVFTPALSSRIHMARLLASTAQ